MFIIHLANLFKSWTLVRKYYNKTLKIIKTMENKSIVQLKSLYTLSLEVVLEKYLFMGEELPQTILSDMKDLVRPVMKRFFVTLEDLLCVNCAWDEGEDLGNNGDLPLDTEKLLYEMDDNHYFTAKFLYNKYSFPVLPSIKCSECLNQCYLDDDGSYHIMDEIIPGEVIEQLYQENMIKFHEGQF